MSMTNAFLCFSHTTHRNNMSYHVFEQFGFLLHFSQKIVQNNTIDNAKICLNVTNNTFEKEMHKKMLSQKLLKSITKALGQSSKILLRKTLTFKVNKKELGKIKKRNLFKVRKKAPRHDFTDVVLVPLLFTWTSTYRPIKKIPVHSQQYSH